VSPPVGNFASEPRWELPDPTAADTGEDLVAIGGGLDPGTVLTAYSRGMFPMEVALGAELGGGSTVGGGPLIRAGCCSRAIYGCHDR